MPTFLHQASDSDFLVTARQVLTVLNSYPAEFPGITQAMIDDLAADTSDFETQLRLHLRKRGELKAQTKRKNAGRLTVRRRIERIRNLTKANGAENAALVRLGIPKLSEGGRPTATVPQISVDFSQRFKHTIHFKDQAISGRKRPRGVLGTEIWVKIGGEEPAGPADCRFLAFDSRSPYVAVYGGEDVGKMAHYLLRWHLRDGTLGPWSETYSATITG